MLVRALLFSWLLATVVACTGSQTGDPAPGSASRGVAGGGAGFSKCGAPLDLTAPTADTVAMDGAFTVASYSGALPESDAYKSLTVFYSPVAPGPFVVVLISPGLTETLQSLVGWARRFASHGYVAVFVEANDTQQDLAAARADGLWAAIGAMKAENTRAGGPLAGKLSECFVPSGHSLGGGASLLVAHQYPNDIKAALGFNPFDPLTDLSDVVAPTLILAGQDDTTAPPSTHGRRQYDSLSPSLAKEYVEIEGGSHQSALYPAELPGTYALSWIKLHVDGDTRFRPFLGKASEGLSDFASTVP